MPLEYAAEINHADPPVTVIEAFTGQVPLHLSDVWAYRELVYFLVWRDLKVRYAQAAIGSGWAILQPFLTMVVFSVFFGKLARMPSDGLPYPVFAYTALVPWTFFANALLQSSNSLVNNAHLITKVYFPRLTVAIAAVLVGLPDLVLAFGVLVGMMVWFGAVPSLNVLWLPVFLLLAITSALGVGLWLAALNVRFRDVRHVLPFLTQLWMFATPVAYPSSLLSEPWRTLYGLNPMVGVVEGFRWALLRSDRSPGFVVGLSAVVAAVILIGGVFHFRHVEHTFADAL